jgi:hypothetical protein
MGCNCGGTKTLVYTYVSPSGQKTTGLTEIQAKVLQVRAGGGTITSKPK